MTDYSALDNRAMDMEITRRLRKIPELIMVGQMAQRVMWLPVGDVLVADVMPEFSSDANAALSLFTVNEIQISIDSYCDTSGKYSWQASFDNMARTWLATADTPARAICLAWLAWKDATDGT